MSMACYNTFGDLTKMPSRWRSKIFQQTSTKQSLSQLINIGQWVGLSKYTKRLRLMRVRATQLYRNLTSLDIETVPLITIWKACRLMIVDLARFSSGPIINRQLKNNNTIIWTRLPIGSDMDKVKFKWAPTKIRCSNLKESQMPLRQISPGCCPLPVSKA